MQNHVVSAALLAAFLASSLFAQSGEITGRVTDASGAVIPGASITVLNTATGQDRRTFSNGDGYFTVPLLLLPGEYLEFLGAEISEAVARVEFTPEPVTA